MIPMQPPKPKKSGANQESSLRPMANGDLVSGRSKSVRGDEKVENEEIQIGVRLRGNDVELFKKVKASLEKPNNLSLDNAEVLRSALRDKAKNIEVSA